MLDSCGLASFTSMPATGTTSILPIQKMVTCDMNDLHLNWLDKMPIKKIVTYDINNLQAIRCLDSPIEAFDKV